MSGALRMDLVVLRCTLRGWWHRGDVCPLLGHHLLVKVENKVVRVHPSGLTWPSGRPCTHEAFQALTKPRETISSVLASLPVGWVGERGEPEDGSATPWALFKHRGGTQVVATAKEVVRVNPEALSGGLGTQPRYIREPDGVQFALVTASADSLGEYLQHQREIARLLERLGEVGAFDPEPVGAEAQPGAQA